MSFQDSEYKTEVCLLYQESVWLKESFNELVLEEIKVFSWDYDLI